MKAATLLVFLLSHQGYWLGGQDQAVTARWVAKDQMPAADLVWDLGLGSVKLDGGTVPLAEGDRPTSVTVKAPAVRVRTTLRWSYRLVQRDGGKVLGGGEFPVHVFPADLTADWAKRIGGRRLVVWDDDGELLKALEAAKVPFARVDDLSKVLDRPDLILVGRDKLDASPFAGEPLVNLARAGGSVAVFEQARPERLVEYPLAKRERPADLRFRTDHPLFDRLEPADLRAWAGGRADVETGNGPLRAVQLPADEPALELAWWPREVAGEQAVPIDALLLTKATDAGRIVLCQLPLGPWERDPRSQIFMGNLLGYLATRPEPTPPPSRRREIPTPAPQTAPTIEFK